LDENEAPKVQWLTHVLSGGGVRLPDRHRRRRVCL